MKPTLICLGFLLGIALLGVSAQAACGGGGFKSAPAESKRQEVLRESQSPAIRNSKLDGLQRDVDKAQAKFDNCDGDCDKERRKLAEAKAKYAKKAGEI